MNVKGFVACILGIFLALFASLGPARSVQAASPLLTEQETAWLKAHPQITVGPDPNFAPIEFFDANGKFSGIAADYLDLLESKLGLEFKVERVADWSQSIQKAKKGEIDIWTAAAMTPQRAEYMRFTAPYLKVPAVIIVRTDSPGENLNMDSLGGLRVAVVRGYAAHDFLANEYPDIAVTTVPDIETGLNKLSFGQIDAFVGNIATAARYTKRAGIGNLRIAGNSGFYYQWALASRKDWPILQGILQKGLNAITPEEAQDIQNRWIALGPQNPVFTTELIFELLTGACLLILIGVLIWTRFLRKLVSIKTEKLQRELTTRTAVEEELQRKNSMMDEVGSLAKVGGWEYDLTTTELIWTKTTYDIHEVDEGFVPNVDDAINFYAPEVRTEIEDAFHDAVTKGIGWDLELPLITAKGNLKWVRARGKSESKDGEVIKLLGAFQDITNQRRVEKDNQRQKNLLEQVGSLATIGGWEIDMLTNEHRWSDTTYKIHELGPDFDPNVEKALNLYAPEVRDSLKETFERAAKKGIGWDRELPLLTVKGNRKWVRTLGQCEVRNGRVVRIYGLTQDITRHHEVENELKKHKEELARQILELEYSHKQLEDQAQALVVLAEEQNTLRAKAEIGEKSKAEFLAAMSHEIRTPMTAIIGMTDLLLLDNLTADQKKRAQTIKSSGETLLAILNDILDQSKLDSGKFELSNIDVSLPDLVDNTLDLLKEKAAEKQLTLKYTPPYDLPTAINIDPIRLQQILINLLSNAIKFTEQGVIALHIEPQETADHEEILRFEVADNGIGISEEHQSRLFERFEQANSSTVRNYGGSGLGLSICKQLVELMEGEIGVKSELGNGSTFWFTVPLHRVSDSALTELATATPDPTDYFEPLNILLAEDNLVNQTLISTMLEHAGHTVAIVDNGEKAVNAVLDGNYDAVLMDVRMPVMEGPEATTRIRESDHPNRDIPIIALTADAMKEHLPRYFEAGMTAVETKPILLPKLLQTLQKVTASASGKADRVERAAEKPLSWKEIPIGEEKKYLELANILDADTLSDLLEIAIHSLSTSFAQLKKSVQSENIEEILTTAHTIRGMAGSMCAIRLVEEISAIERDIDDIDKIAAFMTEIEATVEETLDWWRRLSSPKKLRSA